MSGNQPLGRDVRVLMIEDSPVDARLIETHLEHSGGGFAITRRARLQEAVEHLQESPADVILLDLQLPDSSGLETFLRLKPSARGVPIVILSGHADGELAASAVSRGAQDYLSKDKIDEESLTRSIRYAMERAFHAMAERELSAAAALQRKLLPADAPRLPGLDIAGRCDPAAWIGGDYYDFFHSSEGCLWTVIGDVCGHGLSAGMVTNLTRTTLRTVASFLESGDPGQVLSRAGDLLYDDFGGDTFVSLHLTCLEPDTGRLRYASAGHPAFLLGSEWSAATLQSSEPPVGVVQGQRYATHQAELPPGNLLLLVTDGIFETRDSGGECFGLGRMLDLVQRLHDRAAAEIVDRLFAASAAFAQGAPQTDDKTAVVLKAV